MSQLVDELEGITAESVRMVSLVRESTGLARNALVQADLAAATTCADNDKLVNDLQKRLEGKILSVIAQHQPSGRDLRFLGCAYRSLVDLERAGDYAVHVARSGAELATKPPLKKYLDMQQMLLVAERMMEMSIAAFVESSDTAALKGRAMDEEIDELYEQVQRELLTYMLEDPQTVATATKLLAVARYLERLGDHIENVCEHVLFWLTGDRHS